MFQAGVINQMDIAVRTSGDPEALRGAIRAQMEALDPAAPPYGIITVEQRMSQSVALRRFQTLMLGALAAVALMLALVGAYSIIHRSVASRTQEIGIRSALGASASTISTMVLASGLALGAIGLGIGLVGSVALSRAMASFLYETSPFDPLTYLAVTILLFVVTTAATLTPARRAARIDPIAALRDR
jgi:ABC-type antimicrobial peptide transport system permease subunit